MSTLPPSPPILDRLVTRMISRRIRGAGLVRRLTNRLCTTEELLAFTIYRSAFLLRPADYVDWAVLRDGYYENEVLNALLEALPEGGTFWDVGANFGLHGITVKVVRPDVNVVCFEPSPESASRTVRHSELNCAPVTLMCLGLGDRPGLERFHILSRGNPALSSFVPWPSVPYDAVLSCYLETADRLIESKAIPAPDVIKLDVEGGEVAALQGMSGLLGSRRIRRFVIEGESARIKLTCEHGFNCVQALAGKNYVMDATG